MPPDSTKGWVKGVFACMAETMKTFFTEMLPYKLVGLITLMGAFLLGGMVTEAVSILREQGKAEVISEMPIEVLIRIPIKKDNI